MEALKELVPFLEPSGRLDLKVVALQHVLGLTGSPEGLQMIAKLEKILVHLLQLMEDKSESVAKDAALAVINLSADTAIAKDLLGLDLVDVVKFLWSLIENKECYVADPACMILSNLTIDKSNCDKIFQDLKDNDIKIERIVMLFCQEGYNQKGAKLHYLGPFLSNLSQLNDVRNEILDKNGCVVQRLLPFTEYKESKVRRGGILATLKNCCFDTHYHAWLLGEDVDILPRLLLPLAGPTPEELEAEDIETLPLDLQYLDDDKKMEEDADLRKILLEAILQLCATKSGRESIRAKGTYFILRQLHKVEEDKHVRLACENLVDILIKKEEEINLDNYHQVQVPEDVVPKLQEMDDEYLKD